jgi:hypothetical protein
VRVWAGPLADAPALASEPPILILKVLFWRRTRLLFLFPHSSTASGILNLATVSLSTGSPLFGPGQRRAVAFSITFFAVLGVAAMMVAVLVGVSRLVGYFSGVLWPLAVAGVLALILRPVVQRLEIWVRGRRTVAVFVLYALFVIVIGGMLLLIVPPVIDQVLDFIDYVPTLWSDVTKYGQIHYPTWIEVIRARIENPTVSKMVDSTLYELNTKIASFLPSLAATGGGVVGTFAFLSHVAIVPVYLFFFLLMRGNPKQKVSMELPFVPSGGREDIAFLISEFVGIVESFFRGQLLIGLIMGVLLALGFTLIGLKFGLVIGLTVGLLNIVPYLGSIIGLLVTLPLAFFQPGGGWKLAALVLAVKIVVQSVEGWFLTPKIMGQRTGLHPVIIIISIFFWGTALDGILGMLLAIPITAFVVTAWRLGKRKYLKPLSA